MSRNNLSSATVHTRTATAQQSPPQLLESPTYLTPGFFVKRPCIDNSCPRRRECGLGDRTGRNLSTGRLPVVVLGSRLLNSYFRNEESQISAEKDAELMREETMRTMFSGLGRFGPCLLVGCSLLHQWSTTINDSKTNKKME